MPPIARRCRACRTSALAEGLPLAKLALKLRRLGAQGHVPRDPRAADVGASNSPKNGSSPSSSARRSARSAIHGVTLGLDVGGHRLHADAQLAQSRRARATGASTAACGRIADALVAALKARGGEMRTSAGVKTRPRRRQRVTRRATGERRRDRRAASSISAADPRHTLLDLVGAPELPPEFVWHTQSIKMRGSVAKVHLLTDGKSRPAEGHARRRADA